MPRITKRVPSFHRVLNVAVVESWREAGRVETFHVGPRPTARRRQSTVTQVETQNVWAQTTIGDWRIAYRVGVSQGQPVISELRIYPAEPRQPQGEWSGGEVGIFAPVPAGGITARLVDSLPVGLHKAAIQQVSQSHLRRAIQQGYLLPRRTSTPKQTPSSRGRPRRSEAWYLALVKQYQRLVKAGDRGPCQTIAKQRGWKSEKVRSALARFRKRRPDLLF